MGVAELEGSLIAGKYRVKRRIGAGGMGAVYEGEHVEIGKRVAIKVIDHEHARSPELAARFRREARAASAVESEHIVNVFDVGQDETVGLYMVMEYLVGEDLSARLAAAGGRIPIAEAVTILTQAARALAKAHGAGVVHRDLKPANLFLTAREDGSLCVKVLDFGISKLARPESDSSTSSLTREGSVMGTPMYMSPEQAQGMPVDARTDLWSLGSVLYEALAGRTAYEDRATYEQMIVQIVTQRPRPLREVAPWVPNSIALVVESVLVHDAEGRLADAATFAKKLAEASRGLVDLPSGTDVTVIASAPAPATTGGVAAPPPTATGVVVSHAQDSPKRRPLVWISAAAAVVAIVAIGVVVRRGPAPDGPSTGIVAAPAAAPPPAVASTSVPPLADPPTPSPSVSTPSLLVAPPPPSFDEKLLRMADAGSRAISRPSSPASPKRPPNPHAPSQYGAAGVSTEY